MTSKRRPSALDVMVVWMVVVAIVAYLTLVYVLVQIMVV